MVQTSDKSPWRVTLVDKMRLAICRMTLSNKAQGIGCAVAEALKQ
jgi:hypothetical protein